jgi:hypothetical protein
VELTEKELQIEFMWRNWEKYESAKKMAVFEKMESVCTGLLSYNEWILRFSNLDHAKNIAVFMRHGITEVLKV